MSNVFSELEQEGIDRLISSKDAAGILKVSPVTLHIWRQTGRNKLSYVKIGHRIKYRLSDIKKFIDDKTVNYD